jgi:adenylosuccinate lyase
MASLIFDSKIYGSAWADEAFRDIFDERAMVADWLEILAALALSQAHFDLIPKDAASSIAETVRAIVPDEDFLDEVRKGFEESGHSTQGLIGAIAKRCEKGAEEWLYYGATVQDLTDSWMARALLKSHDLFSERLDKIHAALLHLADDHKHTVMAGRTHGQQGLPITFGFKAAGWAVEVARHQERLVQTRKRLGYGQLSGGVGSMASLGPNAFEIQKMFFEKLGLVPPPISWTSSRDVLAEWSNLLVLISGTADRIGHEIYNLQRSEIGEVKEGFVKGTVGSITMPHKRNPEISEHLGSLSRIVRHNAALVCEGLVHDHERDGRSWKSEWNALPQITMAAGKAALLLGGLVENLEVDKDRMKSNLARTKGFVLSEPLMLALAAKIGRKSAHKIVYETSMKAHDAGLSFKEAVLANDDITDHLSPSEIEDLFDYARHTGHCADMVERLLEGAEHKRRDR